MPVGRHIQTSFAAGEFDPLLWSREDTSFFYNSARIIENAVPLPQGGANRREGWRFRGLQRGPISETNLTGVTITAPNGGTTANLTDNNETTLFTTAPGGADGTVYVIWRMDFASALTFSMVDLNNLRVAESMLLPSIYQITIQRSTDDSTWTDAATILAGTTIANRRIALPPDTKLGTARYWRLVATLPSGASFEFLPVTMSGVRFWLESGYSDGATVGQFSTHRLTTSIENEYVLHVTAGCADIYNGRTGQWVACAAIPHADNQVGQIKNSANLDTLILYHKDRPQWRIQRLGTDTDWRSNALEFDSVTRFPFQDDNVSDGENEIQFLRFDDNSAGDQFVFEFNGDVSEVVTISTTIATTRERIENAIEGLRDITAVSVTTPSGSGANANFDVEFINEDGFKRIPILVVNVNAGNGTIRVSRKQRGRPPTDSLWSEERGYPSCGTFYQGRHWMGGFRSRPDLLVASRAGDLFDFREDFDPVASSPLVVAPNVDDQVTIQNIYPGRHLHIFTSGAEIYIPDEPITIDNIALKVTSRHGSSAATQPVDVQGGTLFVDRNGRALREYLFTDTEQSYSAEPVSFLAGHLMSNPRSMVLRRAREVDEPTMLLIANTGTDRSGNTVPAAMCVIDRAQQVTGFFRVKTQGTVLAFASTQGGDAFAVVQRELAGQAWNYLEQFDESFMSDAAVRVMGSGSIVDLSGFGFLEGQTVEVHGDGLPLGSFVVTGGEVDLGDKSYAVQADVGLKQVPRIVMHSFKGKGEISPTMQNMRIFRALLQMERTGGIAITASDGGRPRQVSLQNYDSGFLDPTLEEVLFSGPKRVGGLGSWQKEPTIEITQVEPMPFLLRSITFDVRY